MNNLFQPWYAILIVSITVGAYAAFLWWESKRNKWWDEYQEKTPCKATNLSIKRDTGYRLHGRPLFIGDMIYHIPSSTWVMASRVRPPDGMAWADPEGIAKMSEHYRWTNYFGA